MRFVHHLLLLLPLCVTQSAWSKDSTVEIELPKYTQWCSRIEMSAADAADPNRVAERIKESNKGLDDALLAQERQSSSMPFTISVTHIEGQSQTNDPTLLLDVCMIVDSEAQAPTAQNVSSSIVSGARVAAIACALESEASCIGRLQSEIATKYSRDLRLVKGWPWRYASASTTPVTEQDFAAALTSHVARPLKGGSEVTEFGTVAPPDPKVDREISGSHTGHVVSIPAAQGSWIVAAVSLPETIGFH